VPAILEATCATESTNVLLFQKRQFNFRKESLIKDDFEART